MTSLQPTDPNAGRSIDPLTQTTDMDTQEELTEEQKPIPPDRNIAIAQLKHPNWEAIKARAGNVIENPYVNIGSGAVLTTVGTVGAILLAPLTLAGGILGTAAGLIAKKTKLVSSDTASKIMIAGFGFGGLALVGVMLMNKGYKAATQEPKAKELIEEMDDAIESMLEASEVDVEEESMPPEADSSKAESFKPFKSAYEKPQPQPFQVKKEKFDASYNQALEVEKNLKREGIKSLSDSLNDLTEMYEKLEGENPDLAAIRENFNKHEANLNKIEQYQELNALKNELIDIRKEIIKKGTSPELSAEMEQKINQLDQMEKVPTAHYKFFLEMVSKKIAQKSTSQASTESPPFKLSVMQNSKTRLQNEFAELLMDDAYARILTSMQVIAQKNKDELSNRFDLIIDTYKKLDGVQNSEEHEQITKDFKDTYKIYKNKFKPSMEEAQKDLLNQEQEVARMQANLESEHSTGLLEKIKEIDKVRGSAASTYIKDEITEFFEFFNKKSVLIAEKSHLLNAEGDHSLRLSQIEQELQNLPDASEMRTLSSSIVESPLQSLKKVIEESK